MKSIYFTFDGDGSHPFMGGWVIVKAKSKRIAAKIFKLYFPRLEDHKFYNYAGIYSEEEFKRTDMYTNGNYGRRCHGIIEFKAFKNKDGGKNEQST